MPYCKISDRAQMSKTIIAVRHFGLGGRESLETAVRKSQGCRWVYAFWYSYGTPMSFPPAISSRQISISFHAAAVYPSLMDPF